MATKIIPVELPPVIRVFLSSTFADMERERSYFNEVLVPKLNRVCAERGVSFFSVDLRWGITEEEQVNGKVLPICLSEIDKCRPFFIGILGNRYGSVMETVSPDLADVIPWLSGKEGHSITELEMLYAVLDREQEDPAKNCSFYLRSDALSAQWYGASEEAPSLTTLKERIRRDEDIPAAEYTSLEEFGRLVETDILRWLDQEFPMPEQVDRVRRAWYDRELLRGYLEVPDQDRFLDNYWEESRHSLLFYGDGARGKTTFLTAWQPKEGQKILINCGSDNAFLYWPSVARHIIGELNEIDPACGMPKTDFGASALLRLLQKSKVSREGSHNQRLSTDFFFVTDEELENFRRSFLEWLEQLPLQETVTVVINDLNLLEDENSRMLSWLPSSSVGKLRFVCSTNNDEMLSYAESQGWNIKELPGFSKSSAKKFILNYLHIYGKNLSSEQLETLLCSPVTAYPGLLRFLADFLINNGRFENLDRLIRDLAKKETSGQVYRYVYDFSTEWLTETERQGVTTVFTILRCAGLSLNESECFHLTESVTGISRMEWARIRNIFEAFEIIKGDYWNMPGEEMQKFVDDLVPSQTLAHIHELLGDDMLRSLHQTGMHSGSLNHIRENTAFAKAVIGHYRSCGNWAKLHGTLMDHDILFYLSKLDWHIVRSGWVDLILHGDIDVAPSLFTLLERYGKEKNGDLLNIAIQTAGLFKDLEQRTHLPRVYEILGTDRILSGLHRELQTVGAEFAEVYNRLHELKSRRQFRQLYELADRLLSSSKNLLPIERCQLLFFKADGEDHLGIFTELLQTSNDYYREAIRAHSLYDLRRALSFRGDALYRQQKYEMAVAIKEQVSRLALRDGDLRTYLAARNILAMCLYRNEKYDESIAEFDRLHTYWNKLGDKLEAGNVIMNQCNALSLKGDYRGALETAKNTLEQLPPDEERLAGLRISLLSNIGAYAVQLKDYAEAEVYLRRSVVDGEALGKSSTVIKSNSALIHIYEKTDRIILAVERYTAQLELLWSVRDYGTLVETLRDATLLLVTNKYGSMARNLQKQWEQRFAQMPGGKEFFDKAVHKNVFDDHHAESLREALAIARSEGDPQKIADASYKLAAVLQTTGREEAVELLLNAVSLYDRCGLGEKYTGSVADALQLLMEKGVVKEEALYKRLLSLVSDPTILRIAEIWRSIGSDTEGNLVPELLAELVTYNKDYGTFCLTCMTDTVEKIVAHCTARQILDPILSMEQKDQQILAHQLDTVMLKDANQKINGLTKDYGSNMALETLGYFEKCVEVLTPLGSPNIAAILGNLALIYRRRREVEKTIQYHTLSKKLYEEKGATRDALIELTNIATAYREFGQTEKAFELLRQGLQEATAGEEHRSKAFIAGNLANFLAQEKNPAFRDEIIRCFAIEEAYFRKNREPRDLAISLINQLRYIILNELEEPWEEKLHEVGQLIRSNGFREFEKILSQLEWIAQSKKETPSHTSASQLEELVEQLLAPQGSYELKAMEEREGSYYAICEPKEPSATDVEQLCFILDPKVSCQVDVIFLCQPKLRVKDTITALKKYIDWWNELAEYRLILHEDRMVLRAVSRIQGANWEEITHRFLKTASLWKMDRMFALSACLGLGDLSMFQTMKLKELHGDD